MDKLKFIDLFAGIGGFHLALHDLNAECVFASEIDLHARATYEANFKKISKNLFLKNCFSGDITKISTKDIPEFDILCAGFPCQPFSQAGYKRGFSEEKDKRGNMFFEIVRILKAKKPKAFFLENVRHLKNHESGATFDFMKNCLENLGYSFHAKIVKASDHGLPQHRARLFMVGFLNEITATSTFQFPDKESLEISMSDIFGGKCNKDIGYTLRVGGRSSGLHDRRNWDTYIVNNIKVKLTFREGKKIMGFPENFIFPVTEVQALKQLGNSVAVPAIKATAKKLIQHIHSLYNNTSHTLYYNKAVKWKNI